jgi:hypothetical protein
MWSSLNEIKTDSDSNNSLIDLITSTSNVHHYYLWNKSKYWNPFVPLTQRDRNGCSILVACSFQNHHHHDPCVGPGLLPLFPIQDEGLPISSLISWSTLSVISIYVYQFLIFLSGIHSYDTPHPLQCVNLNVFSHIGLIMQFLQFEINIFSTALCPAQPQK